MSVKGMALMFVTTIIGSAIGSALIFFKEYTSIAPQRFHLLQNEEDASQGQITCPASVREHHGDNDSRNDGSEKAESDFTLGPDVSFIEDGMGEYSFKMLAEALRRKGVANNRESSDIITVGIAGGTGSGKTTLTMAIYEVLGQINVTYLTHDNYYKDLSHLPIEEREKQNFDHPNSLDTNLLVEHIKSLKQGKTVQVPDYSFASHTRTSRTTLARPTRVILVEGILLFAEPELVEQLDVKIFVDTDSDVRLMRRISRDCKERGRTLDQVLKQYAQTVRPMHLEFVEPSKKAADVIIPLGLNPVALSLITDHLSNVLNREK
eukprot:CAMPEP_0113312778 /NCGR_PEP_ID=MMETSP0010_2-20120614/9475_1 /TAXON_ID=216773 ORGANISM="Corethron hystrix, Strain 308" /NCGR_SAMPLE_ID=MMETSP0010_2 /ASSEMBLY_ACC=CAM_ASM_000155 /LENGTH=320 /DNA_ID=CAMNT_0000168677 /DNA_START=146 /DNA_END=1108 /DNA_ORIENTATION=- /assembly_acc=CAM_ASM_000155